MSVSFILPVYRGELTLPGCLDSLIRLRFHDWECVAVNDCSPDGSEAILREYARREPRLRVVAHAHNLGVSAARNTGLGQAKSEFVHFLDQDDHLLPQGVGKLHLHLKRHPDAAAVHGDYVIIDSRTRAALQTVRTPDELTFADFAKCNHFPPLAVLARRDLILTVGGLQVGMEGTDDWDLWGRLARTGRRFFRCPALMGEYRIHESNNTLNSLRMLSSGLKVLEHLYSPDPRVPKPSPLWSLGAHPSAKCRAISGMLWAHVALQLARPDTDKALELLDWGLRHLGREVVTALPFGDFHSLMVAGCLFAGRPWYTYFLDLAPSFTEFFESAAILLGDPGFASEGLRQLLVTYFAKLAEEKAGAERLLNNYRTSRSYRLGRKITSCLRWLGRTSGCAAL